MKFQVIWEKPAENDLAELWLNAVDRDAVTQAADEMDEILAAEGFEAGESRFGNVRILINLPLSCYFQYRESDRTILVTKVWHS